MASNVSIQAGAGRLLRVAARLVNQAVLWRDQTLGRRLLARLDDRMLRDIGLSRSDVERESAKFFWQR